MTNIKFESIFDVNTSPDCDFIMLEILTQKIVSYLGDLLKSMDSCKRISLKNVDDYNNKKELMTSLMATNNWDENHEAKFVRIFCATINLSHELVLAINIILHFLASCYILC